MLRRVLALGLAAWVACPIINATAQSKPIDQWKDPPPQRAHNAGFAVAMVQWAVTTCGGSINENFKDVMTVFGRPFPQAFNLGHEEGSVEMKKLAAKRGDAFACRVVGEMYGPNGDSAKDSWRPTKP